MALRWTVVLAAPEVSGALLAVRRGVRDERHRGIILGQPDFIVATLLVSQISLHERSV